MADTLQARLSATIIDALGTQAQCNSYARVDPATSFGDLVSIWEAWLTALDAVTAGRIVRSAFTLYPLFSGLKAEPTSDSRVVETALLFVTGPSSIRRDPISIPGVADSLVGAGNQIITGSGAVADFLSLIVTGGTGLEFATSDFDAPLTFKDSALTFREYNNQLEPHSFVLA